MCSWAVDVKDLSGMKVAVIGLGASGVAAVRLALVKRGEVYVSDVRTDAQTAARGDELRAGGADVELGRHDIERIAAAGLVVVSPGIPPNAPVLRALADRGVRCISEPELAFRFFSGPLIAVTGTNGKTTTALLVAHLLEAARIRVAVGGNVGGGLAPVASELALLETAPDWYVLEMSSFQLGRIETFAPRIGVVTNLSPDHLDWYENFASYEADKARLFENATEASLWVLPHVDAAVEALAGDAPGRRFTFGAAGSNAFEREGELTLRLGGHDEAVLPRSELPLIGRHNVANALAAALTARLAGASVAGIAEGLRTTKALPHRMEPVVDRGGILWVNDSKATNVSAARSALESLSRPVVLLLGGKDKGGDFAGLSSAMGGVRVVLAFGAAGPRAAAEIGAVAPIELLAGPFEEVVARAADVARRGDVVLLSPACSSFDMFESYEHRGRRFAELAREAA